MYYYSKTGVGKMQGKTAGNLTPSADDFLQDAAVHVGESHVASAEAKSELFVVDAEQVQDGGMHIVNIDGVFHGAHPHFVGGTERRATTDTGTSHPDAVAAHMMVASITA